VENYQDPLDQEDMIIDEET